MCHYPGVPFFHIHPLCCSCLRGTQIWGINFLGSMCLNYISKYGSLCTHIWTHVFIWLCSAWVADPWCSTNQPISLLILVYFFPANLQILIGGCFIFRWTVYWKPWSFQSGIKLENFVRLAGIIFGLWNSHTSMGNILGSLIAGEYVENDWSLSFIVPGILIAVMGFVIFLFLVVRPVDVDCPLPDQVCD